MQPTGDQIRFDFGQPLLHEFVPFDAFQRTGMNPFASSWHMDQPQEIAAVRSPTGFDSYFFFAKHPQLPNLG